MANDIALQNNWDVFELNGNQRKISQLIDFVKHLDNDTISTDLWTKWKNSANQIVIETPNYFFKLYNGSGLDAEYLCHVREKLGEIYRTEYNLNWDVKTIYKDNKLYQIERREKLQVCNPSIISMDDLYIKYGELLNKLEQKLLFPKITKQIYPKVKEFGKELYQIKLIRDCMPAYEDYAITNDGNIILLDDSDWFIYLVDKNGNILYIPNTYFEVVSSFDYNSILCPCNLDKMIKEGEDIGNAVVEISKWTITKHKSEMLDLQSDLINKYEETICDTVKILTTGKKLENKALSYDVYDKNLLLK